MNILCCYNVNIDSVCTVDGAKITDYIKSHEIKDPPDQIRDMSDFLALLLMCMENGTGGEYLLETPAAIRESSFLIKNSPVLRLGGNAGIAADVLSNLGATLVIPNVASLSRRQADLLSGDAIQIPVYIDDEVVLSKPYDAVRDREEAIHYVFLFEKGTEITLPGRTIRAPDNNRIIATYDPKNIAMHVDAAFKDFSDAHIAEMNGALVSGFHLLRNTYPDGLTYIDQIHRVIEQLKGWKSSNPNLMIHFESGDFLDGDIREHVISYISDVVDSIGMNEEEFLKGDVDFSAINIIEKAIQAIDKLGISRLCIHTRDFIVSIFDPAYIDAASEIDALNFGASASAARARAGYVNQESIHAAIRNLKPNTDGIRECSMLQEHFNGKRIGKGVHLELNDYSVCIVPSLWCAHPVTTVGLGDTMTAAVFLRELERCQ
ncbi:MAG: ADP-dependent glucokinase/phosphofructokinase [Euryarchaeota archaeon]|nr:ADP-dependent glucokinase/phosphofructokinase [Euryarchaeota archaeon]